MVRRLGIAAVLSLVFAGALYGADEQAPKVLFEDNFDTMDPVWGEANDVISVKDHKFIMKPAANTAYTVMNQGQLFDDFDASVNLRQAEGKDPTYGAGLVFWGDGLSNYYYIYASPDGQYVVSRYVNNRRLSPVPWRATDAVKKGHEVNQLRVVTRGDKATLYINGKELATIKGQPPQGGSFIGMRADSPPQSQDVWEFSDLKVTAPPTTAVAAQPGVGAPR
jgi:hypothetical protein